MIVFMVANYLRAARWRVLFVNGTVSTNRLFVVQNIGIGLNNVVPIRVASEAVQIAILSLRDGVRASVALATVGMERVLDLVVSALILGVSLILIPEMERFTLYIWGAIGIAVISVVVVRILAWGSTGASWVARLPFLAEFLSAVKDLEREWTRLAMSTAITLVYWLLVGVTAWLIADAISLSITPIVATAVIMGTIYFATAIPAAPAAIGTFEFAVVYVLETVRSHSRVRVWIRGDHSCRFLPASNHHGCNLPARRRHLFNRTPPECFVRDDEQAGIGVGMRPAPLWSAILGCLILVLATGCGQDVEPTPTPLPTTPPTATTVPSPTATAEPTATSAPSTATPSPTAVPAATASPVPVTPTPVPTPDSRNRGGTLNLSTSENIPHLDIHLDVSPALSTWGPGIAYSRLLRLKSGPDVVLPSLEVECDLCSSWTMESPTTYSFELRHDVRWHDVGPVYARPLTVSDIVFSYLRQSDSELPNSALLHNIAGLRETDSHMLSVTFDAPDADALIAFADGHSKIVAREAVEQDGDLRDGPTVGSGPWVLEKTAPDDKHQFSPNPFYYEQGLPLIENLNILILTGEDTRRAAFLTGMIDVMNMRPDEWLTYTERFPLAPFMKVPQPGIGVEVAFNTTVPPFDNVEVRRAAILGMEPAKAIEEHWGGFGFIGHGFSSASPEWLIPQDELVRRFDRRADAETVLSKAGVTAPIPVSITVGDYGPVIHRPCTRDLSGAPGDRV